MPTFYLHVSGGSGFTEDEKGAEFADLAGARRAAIAGLRDVFAGELQAGRMDLATFIEIENKRRELVMTVTFEDAVQTLNEARPRSLDA